MNIDLRLTTVLSAVNYMLGMIGGSEVNSVEDIQNDIEAYKAYVLLEETNLKVQSEGWNFNTYEDYTLTRNVDNEIILGDNVLKIHAYNKSDAFVERGRKLYDLNDNTFEFEEDVEVFLTELLQFEQLPQNARFYITYLATQDFQMMVEGTTSNLGFTQQKVEDARRVLEDEDSKIYNYNIFDEDPDLTTLTSR